MKHIGKKITAFTILTSLLYAEAKVEKIKFSGDIRFRGEGFEDVSKAPPEDTYIRPRIRARLKATAQVNDWAKGVFALCSEASAISCNKTLEGLGSSKGVYIDLAYADLKLPAGFNLKLGKMKFSHYKPAKSELIFDGDYNPEGAFLGYKNELGALTLNVNAGEYWLVNAKEMGKDIVMTAGQIATSLKSGENTFKLGTSYYGYGSSNLRTDLKGVKGLTVKDDKVDGKGNSLQNDTYATGYETINAYVEAKLKLGKTPLSIYGEYAHNIAADSLNKAFQAGVIYGKAKKPGTLALKALYRSVEKDAVLGQFYDSDFLGGKTNGHGVETALKTCVGENIYFDLSYFYNLKDLTADDTTRYQRVQADLVLKF
jgi:hypothetical protein